MHRRAALVSIVAVFLVAAWQSSCSKKKHAVSRLPAMAAPISSTEVGLASWYGYPYHGRVAANGEVYDMEKMTAAHRTLPFGTWVRVTNLKNGKSAEVRITDRGPFIAGRVIDLSHAAARDIELIGPGVAQVRIDLIAARSAPSSAAPVIAGWFAVQVGAFQDRERAESLRSELGRQYGTARVVYRDGRPAMWRVLVGIEKTMDAANVLAVKLQAEVGSGFVVRLDAEPAESRLQPGLAAPQIRLLCCKARRTRASQLGSQHRDVAQFRIFAGASQHESSSAHVSPSHEVCGEEETLTEDGQ